MNDTNVNNAYQALARKELNKFDLPKGYSRRDVLKSKKYLMKTLSFLLHDMKDHNDKCLTKERYDIMINVIGKISNIQAFDTRVNIMEESLEQTSIITCGNDIDLIILWQNNLEKTVIDLCHVLSKQNTFMPEAGGKKSYFNNESVVVMKKTLVK